MIGLNNQSIIIFGGISEGNVIDGLTDPPSICSLCVLNISNFVWSNPKLSVSGQIPSTRVYHQANVIGKYMVISFGKYHVVQTNFI